jgi:type II secretory pathway pseudopilin PulG
MNHAHKKQHGFTIIELTLAMTFISFLLLGIALTVIQIGAIYNKGTTSKEINQASRTINTELDRDISTATSLNLTTDYVQAPLTGTAAGGRLCLGSYSYIWNFARAIDAGNANVAKYLAPPDSTKNSVVRLIKVADPAKVYCAKNPANPSALANPNIRAVDSPIVQELLSNGDHEIGLHNFAFITPIPASSVDASTGQQIFSLTYTIGTAKISALNATQTACLGAGNANADPLYCNVQQFSLVVRAGNGVN